MGKAKQAVRKRASGAAYNRRANGDGALFQRARGDWVARVPTGMFDKNGQPQFKAFTNKRQDAVIARRDEYVKQRDAGLLVDYSAQSMAEYAQGFLERYCAGKAINTQRNYQVELGHFLPVLGGVRLQEIKPKHIQGALEHMQKVGYRRKEGGKVWTFSNRTLRRSLVMLRAMFEEAVRLQVVSTNPAAAVKVAAQSKEHEEQGRALEAKELAILNAALEKHPMGVYFRLLMTTGLRKGEALALTWGDIDLDERPSISVHRTWHGMGRGGFTTPKTKSSKRKVPLPESMAEVLRVLRAATQAKLEQDISGLHLFCNPATNLPWDPKSPYQALERICKKEGVGLRRLRVHDLRHTYGTHLISSGVDLAVVSRYMGHANINVTLGVYRHLLQSELGAVPDVLEMAMQKVASATPQTSAQDGGHATAPN